MKIGIVGLGAVGNAIKKGFSFLNHEVYIHDIKFKTNLSDVINTEIVYICVPTPIGKNGSCDTSIVEKVVKDLHKLNYDGIIAIKSTVIPGTTQKLIKKYSNTKICHVPEFLREKFAYEDFVDNHNVLVVGSLYKGATNSIIESHGNLPKSIQCLKPEEAELVKYFSNSYKASKIIFANSFAELCKNEGVDYELVKDTYLLHGVRENEYFSVTENLRGFGGACLPKDVSALKGYVDKNDIDIKLFDFLINENKKFTT
jgi:UDPglucose 6-dehydrogenase